jgi:hypothetical protein
MLVNLSPNVAMQAVHLLIHLLDLLDVFRRSILDESRRDELEHLMAEIEHAHGLINAFLQEVGFRTAFE